MGGDPEKWWPPSVASHSSAGAGAASIHPVDILLTRLECWATDGNTVVTPQISVHTVWRVAFPACMSGSVDMDVGWSPGGLVGGPILWLVSFLADRSRSVLHLVRPHLMADSMTVAFAIVVD